MDAITIERLKHAQEVLGWMADGKEIQWLDGDSWKSGPISNADQRVFAIMSGCKYRLKPAKTIRPFTEQEARRLVGCVLVAPSGQRGICTATEVGSPMFYWMGTGLPTVSDLCNEKWHYHLPGDPDNLKPCWVEE